MKTFIVVLCFLSKAVASLTLVNDTPFTLVAEVQGASGILLNQITIQPGEQTKWVQDYRAINLDIPGQPDTSTTPYQILWKCSNGGFFSTCYNVASGAFVKASYCSGAHFCKPRDPEPEKPQCPDCICPPYPLEQQPESTQESNKESSS